MSHKALRPMKWGTATGMVHLKVGDALPDADKVSQRMLDRLYRRGWITDSGGGRFDKRHETHGQAGKPGEPPRKAPAPVPAGDDLTPRNLVSLPTKLDIQSELNRLSRHDLNDIGMKRGVEDPAGYPNKTTLIEAIIATEE